jgi:hypothetical protein
MKPMAILSCKERSMALREAADKPAKICTH